VSISLKTQKMLWGRAATRCGYPGCRKELVMDATETDDESLVGEACHIVSRSPQGPRGESELTAEQRDKYGNLVLMCNLHHKLIDDQPGEYTVEKLCAIKSEHEQWVKEKLDTYDDRRQKDDELYAAYVEQFESFLDIINWDCWTCRVCAGGQPTISKCQRERFEEMRNWLLNRIWPKRYERLEDAFENFRRVLQDFLNKFDDYSIERGDSFSTRKFYKIDRWDEEAYKRLYAQYEYHCYLVEDLMLELTRASNFVFDRVREFITSSYRLDEGVLLIASGPYMDHNIDLRIKTHRPEYRDSDRVDIPYPGLELFSKATRFEREFYFGEKA